MGGAAVMRLERAVLLALILVMIGWKAAHLGGHAAAMGPGARLQAVLGDRLSAPVGLRPWGAARFNSDILTVPMRGCPRPLLIVTLRPSFLALPALKMMEARGSHHFFAYLDWVTDTPDRWQLLALRVRQRVAAMAGLSAFQAEDVMLFVSEPAGCDQARSLPWLRYWRTAR